MPIHFVPLPLLAAVAPWMIYIPAVLLGVAILVRVLGWMWIKKAEEDFKRLYPEQWKLLHPEQPEPDDDGSGKRPGQFRIFDLLVLMTFAGGACAIIRLPIHVVLKMFAILALWLGFSIWVCGVPNARKARSMAFKRRVAVMHAVGSILAITPVLWLYFVQGPRGPVFATASFLLVMLLGPIQAIWSAARAAQAEFSAARRRKAAAP